MPKIVRTMREQDGMPAIGTASSMLGARVPQDINSDDEGKVHPNTGGISVARSIRDLPAQFIPKRLRHLVPGARNSNNQFVWKMGDGDFSEGAIATYLNVRQKPKDSGDQVQGFIEPDAVILMEEYQAALAATQSSWSIDEPT